jgi:uncharacterized protein YjbJ (UPF0337 family)
MDENRIEGAARNVAGKVEKTVGSVTGNRETEGRGMAQEAIGEVQNLYGNAADTVRGYATEKPLSALLVAGGIGMALAMLIGRRR